MTIYPPTCMMVKWGVEKRELNGGGMGRNKRFSSPIIQLSSIPELSRQYAGRSIPIQ